MKTCEEFAPLLSAFVDGELTENERAEVLAHVSGCAGCRARLDELFALHDALGALEEPEVPADLTAKVMAAVRAEKAAQTPQRKNPGAWRRWAAVAACAAVALFAAVTIPQMGSKTANDTAAPADTNGQALFSMSAPTSEAAPEAQPDQELPEQRWDAVQYAPGFDGAAEDTSCAKYEPEMTAGNSGFEPEYYCETVFIGENGETGELFVAWYGAVTLELYGAGATDYVLENGGVKADDAGYYYVPIDALRDLPEGLGMTDAQAETLSLAPAEAEWLIVYPDDYAEVPQA